MSAIKRVLFQMTGSSKRDCVRLRGLPYEAQVQQVVDFLGIYARNIVYQVILLLNFMELYDFI